MHPPETVNVQSERTPGNWSGRLVLPLAGLALAGLVAHGILQRRDAEAKLASWTDERAIPNVALVSPHLDTSPTTFTLPGQVEAFYEAEIHGQVAGYIKEWSKDIGAAVKKGEVLAVIDTPELDAKIAQAQEELSRAKAAQALADMTAQRWGALRSTSAVSKQASDEKESDSQVKHADVGATTARIGRLLAKKAFARVVAPFDGIITARNTDIGSLVNITGDGPPLFKVADIHAVRVYVSAPQSYVARLRKGLTATMKLAEHPGRTFAATIATTSNAIELQSRTLLVELEVENPDHALLPGAYADVRFSLPSQNDGHVRVPSSALSVGREGVRVVTLGDDRRAHFKKISIANDLGAEIEVASGLSPEDRIIDNPGDELSEGDEVRISRPAASMKNANVGHEPTR